jgi:prophage regulatory protein
VRPIFLGRQQAAEALAISDSTLEKLTRQDPTFPKPRKISANRVGWLYREIEAWAEARPPSDIPPP